jgi:phosphoribosylformylglycinamidine synthase
LRSAVQVGNPFLEKLLIEACLEISSLKGLVGMQDCGAAGITSAAIEMAKRSNLGINIDVSKVPTREKNMTPYEIMLSESQERMLLAVTANEEKEIFEVFDKWDLKCAIIGEFIEGDDASVFNKNNLLSKTSISVLTEAPEYDLEKIIIGFKPKKHTFKLEKKYLSFEKQIIDKYLNKIIKSNNIVSKKSIYQKYDHHVQTNTVIEPGQDAAIIRIKGTDKMLLFSCDGNSRYCHIDPKIGAEISIAEACRNVSVMGGNPIAITDGLNFGDPTTPRGAYELIETFKGFNSACEKFNIPIISGNASLFNEGHVSSIYPTPIIGVMGIMNKTNKIPSLGFNKIGDLVGLLGKKFWGSTKGLSGSEFQNIISNNSNGELIFDIDYEIILQKQIRTLADNNLIESAHDTSLGGIIVSLIKACNSKHLGVEINKHLPEDWASAMFGEDQSRVIFSFKANNKEKIAKVLADFDWEEIGMVTSKDIIFKNITFETDNLLKNYNKGFSTKL